MNVDKTFAHKYRQRSRLEFETEPPWQRHLRNNGGKGRNGGPKPVPKACEHFNTRIL
jgi:hypothetical protein